MFAWSSGRGRLANDLLARWDALDGIAFEQEIARVVRRRGRYSAEVTPATGDFGIEVIARHRCGGRRTGIQVKRYQPARRAGAAAVMEAHAGAASHRCDAAAVVTIGRFTSAAVRLAERLEVRLIDRAALAAWARTGRSPFEPAVTRPPRR